MLTLVMLNVVKENTTSTKTSDKYHIYICTYLYIHVQIHVQIQVDIHIHIHLHLHIHMHMHIHIPIHIHVHIYISIYLSIFFLTSTGIKYTSIIRQSTDTAFPKYAALPEFRCGETVPYWIILIPTKPTRSN